MSHEELELGSTVYIEARVVLSNVTADGVMLAIVDPATGEPSRHLTRLSPELVRWGRGPGGGRPSRAEEIRGELEARSYRERVLAAREAELDLYGIGRPRAANIATLADGGWAYLGSMGHPYYDQLPKLPPMAVPLERSTASPRLFASGPTSRRWLVVGPLAVTATHGVAGYWVAASRGTVHAAWRELNGGQ